MRCLSCQCENSSESKFCLRCGKYLSYSCLHCEAELPVEAQFCNMCGHAVSQLKTEISTFPSIGECVTRLRRGEGIDLARFVEGVENHLLTVALDITGGNRTLAAELLGSKRTTLLSKLRRGHEIEYTGLEERLQIRRGQLQEKQTFSEELQAQIRQLKEELTAEIRRRTTAEAGLQKRQASSEEHAATGTIDEVEREAIRLALQKAQGDKVVAAKRLGISIRTLYRKLERFSEDKEEKRYGYSEDSDE